MVSNAVIKGIAYYHPKKKVDNEFYIEHFKKRGMDITGLLSATGRKTRYISEDDDETIVTMGTNAAKKVLAQTFVKPSQLNLIVFASGTPEYIMPTNALIIHAMLGAGQKTAVFDMNANCAGMVAGLDYISRAMRNNPNIKYALLVGSDQFSKYARHSEAITYANFGDAACALVLENIYNVERGFIDSDFYTNSSNYEKIMMPAKGMTSVIHDQDLSIEDKLARWTDFDFSGVFYSARISIEEVLFRNNMTTSDVKTYCVSQFAKNSMESICRDLDEDINKFIFIGDEYGYTGVTSPFLAYAKAYERGIMQRGDNIIFWTVGAGTTCACILYRF
jgi:3-oxoacyl-[acyl-carrier-protein] synthase-3